MEFDSEQVSCEEVQKNFEKRVQQYMKPFRGKWRGPQRRRLEIAVNPPDSQSGGTAPSSTLHAQGSPSLLYCWGQQIITSFD